jgi:hypothetical protein
VGTEAVGRNRKTRAARREMMFVPIGKAEKRCSACRKRPPLKEFRRQKGRPHDRTSRCREGLCADEEARKGKRSRPYCQRTQAQREVAEEVRKLLKRRAKAVAV